jgi:pyruvate formate-lyase/glycerol dehydratase family glycyl radical enzyme
MALNIDHLNEIDKVSFLTERIEKRIKAFRDARPFISGERAVFLTKSWQETEGEPIPIRRAKGFARMLDGIPIVIRDGELIVGSQTEHVRGCFAFPEWDAELCLKEFEKKASFSMDKDYFEAETDERQREMILEAARFWNGKSVVDKIWDPMERLWGNRMKELYEARVFFKPFNKPASGGTVNYERALNEGLSGVIAEIKKELSKPVRLTSEGLHKLAVRQGMTIACEAVIRYAQRHAKLARELAEKERDKVRKSELERIAEACDWVPANPPRNFYEALQSFWFVHLAVLQEAASESKSPGRFDQYIYPFLRRDLSEKKLTYQEAAVLLGCLWIKFNEVITFRPGRISEFALSTELQNLTIGGVDRKGDDATNELSYLILECERQLKLPQPQLTLRYHDKLPERFLLKAGETNRDHGGGKPAFFNDKPTILGLCQEGVTLEDARDWAPQGCVERYVQFASGGYRKTNVNLAKAIELAFANGADPLTGKRLGPSTGEPTTFKNFGNFYNAVKKQVAYMIENACNFWSVGQIVRGKEYPLPFHSALTDDCIITGLDVMEGGMRYPQLFSNCDIVGHQNVANSLAAVKKVVYEDKAITLAELMDALKANFEGKDRIRAMLLAVPKYGNDDDYADGFMKDIFEWTKEMVHQHMSPWGHRWGVVRKGLTAHYYFGKGVGAMPDGRKAYEPLADASVSPMRGTDVKGPTAVLNSAAKLDHVGCEATLLNQKFLKSLLSTTEGIKKLLALIKTYFDHYAYQIQVNILNPEELIEAKKHPERYRDLVVRVAGYSAYFIELSPEVQDEIIARTTHSQWA